MFHLGSIPIPGRDLSSNRVDSFVLTPSEERRERERERESEIEKRAYAREIEFAALFHRSAQLGFVPRLLIDIPESRNVVPSKKHYLA